MERRSTRIWSNQQNKIQFNHASRECELSAAAKQRPRRSGYLAAIRELHTLLHAAESNSNDQSFLFHYFVEFHEFVVRIKGGAKAAKGQRPIALA